MPEKNFKTFGITIHRNMLDKYLRKKKIIIAYFRHKGISYRFVGHFERDDKQK